MALRTTVKPPQPRRHEKPLLDAMARAHTLGMAETVRGAQMEMRDDVLAAGLGAALANSVRSEVYPGNGTYSLQPAGMVYAAPGKSGGRSAVAILGFYESGRPITPIGGAEHGLAIPTNAVPRTGRGGKRAMSPVEVEAFFNQEMIPRRMKNGKIGLFLNLVASRSGRSFRAPTDRRNKQGRESRLVLMFTMIKQRPGDKRLSFGGIVRRWGGRLGDFATANFEYRG